MQLAITALSFQGAVLILVGRLVQEHGLGWLQAFGFPKSWPRAAVVGFMSAFSVLPTAWMLQVGSVRILTWLDWNPVVQHAVNIFELTSNRADRLILGLVALVLAPIAEELLFRGIMYPALKGFGMPRFAFWSTAIVFSLIHFNVATFLPLLLFACVLNLLYEWTGNLLACMVAHATFNAINLVMLLFVKPLFE
jgi:membrane protease YdiL (CAAX protease family)